MRSLRKMEDGMMEEHVALHWSDECYYLLEFHPGKRYGFHPDNDLIKNFKRRIDRGGELARKRKEWAIRDIAHMLRPALASLVDFDVTTFVSIPPSKTRANPFYDDRVSQLLRLACPSEADIQELISCRADQTPAHFSEIRPSVAKLLENYVLGAAAAVRDRIVLFDDVITSGHHFVACRQLLLEHFAGHEVVGVFVARRVLV
jgi:predicted amidophosphoribosyltransferase